MRREEVRNSWERVYPRTEVLPQFPKAQPPLSRSRNTRTDRNCSKKHRHRHLCLIRTTWSRSRKGWFLIPHCTPPRQSSRESPFIGSSLAFQGHISQSYGPVIHSQRHCLGHTSFFMHGDRSVYSVPRFQPGTDPFIGHPSRKGKMPVYIYKT